MSPQVTSQAAHVETHPTAADCTDFLQRIKTLAQEYEENLQKRKVDLEFNLFVIISDRYHQENLHSDILKALIDPNPNCKHEEQNKYLQLFLKFINSHEANINLSDYSNARVVREKGRIDILIKDEVSKHAIIIENKINNACDQPEQLPGYLKQIEKDYVCDAIIYLRLNGKTSPDMATYKTDDDRNKVNDRLKVICAYDENEPDKDLLNGWILKCKEVSTNHDAQHILGQYGDLIKNSEETLSTGEL